MTINGYELSRAWFDFCFENPEIINTNHSAMYFFIIEHCNRMGWKEKFGLPMEMTKDAIGIKNYRTFSKTFNDLVEWGFIKMVQKSKNQYSANVIALVKNTKANTKALSKALQKQSQKQVHGIVGIIKPNNLLTLEPINKEEIFLWTSVIESFHNDFYWKEKFCRDKNLRPPDLEAKMKEFISKIELQEDFKDLKELKSHFFNWYQKNKTNGTSVNGKFNAASVTKLTIQEKPEGKFTPP